MCYCNPSLRTLYCGSVDCIPPEGSVISNNTIPNLSKTKKYLDISYKAGIEIVEDTVVITRHGVNALGNDVGFSENMLFDKLVFKKFILDLLEG
ncbi:hypothetical protein VP424E501_P0214 [Vibrio phage 424E50-1]|nr:hypothetical protein VP424E501_P0214 [Vibrio phage 424E50-1]